ncbi:MAG: NAD(P)H-dependent oxidoreductase subunit E [Bacteroidota bacterium]
MSDFKVDHKQYRKENRKVEFTAATLHKVKEIIGRYPDEHRKSALLPVLHIAQEELDGFLSVDVMNYVAGLIEIQPIEVYEVATFYTQFYLEKTGKYVIEVCRTGPCAICGGEKISEYIQKKLSIGDGETTADGLFTLREVECLGACGYAPAMQINTEFYEFLTEVKTDMIIDDLRKSADKDKQEGSRWTNKFF